MLAMSMTARLQNYFQASSSVQILASWLSSRSLCFVCLQLTPPGSLLDVPVNAVTSKFVRTSTNKFRCPIFCVTVCTVPSILRVILMSLRH